MQEEVQEVAVVNGNAEGQKPGETSTSAASAEEPQAVNGSQPAENGNGEKKAKKEKKEKKAKKEKKEKKAPEPKEPPKSLQEDPIDWLKHHAGVANHKANYDLLTKIAARVEEDESKRAALPGKPDTVSNSQFVSALADGRLASELVNKLSIIAAVPVAEGEEEQKKKEHQIALLQAFVDFAKTEGGVPEEKLPVIADVQEGKKSAYPAIFATLVMVMGNKGVVSAEQLANDAVKYAEENTLPRKARAVVSQISHSFSNLKLSRQRKKSSGEGAHENGVAENANVETNGVAESGANGNGETSHAPNGNVATEESKQIEESRAVAAN